MKDRRSRTTDIRPVSVWGRAETAGAFRTAIPVLLACCLLLAPLAVQAETPGAVPPLDTGLEKSYGIDASMDIGKYGEDYFLTVGLGGAFTFSKFSFGIQAPLRIRIYEYDLNDAGEDEKWYREEDWDDVSDWFRILRFFQYGTPKDLFYGRLGELVAATIGHGTIMSRYYNTLDIDHYYMGIRTNLNLEGGGFEFLVNDITSWRVAVLRGYLRPFTLFMEEPHKLLKGLGIGITYAYDHSAPFMLKAVNSSGSKVLTSYDEEFVYVLGIDIEWEAFRNDTYAITPYMDVNFFDGANAGLHIGLLNELNIAKSQIMFKLEYRAVGPRYAPNYFSTLYDIERWSFLQINGANDARDKPCENSKMDPADPNCGIVPKYRYYMDSTNLELRNGFYGELYANIVGLIGIGAIYEDYQGDDNASVTLRADLPEIAGVKVAAYYTRRNFDGFGEFFDLDKALLIAEARWKFYGPMYIYALYASTWRQPKNAQTVEREDSWHIGFGVSYSW